MQIYRKFLKELVGRIFKRKALGGVKLGVLNYCKIVEANAFAKLAGF